MKNLKPNGHYIALLLLFILHVVLARFAEGSVLPRPNIRQRPTTQVSTVDNYTGERAIVVVTSSELPKQIPPPPTPTKPHRPTPRYDMRNSVYDKDERNKELYESFRLTPE
ncbi:hypothetical protein RUM44_011446 [Polyplax serrata]|uniref:Uncharacterized protein n=1 Tax=Polyplax serrata TaxID=468196 RepID=A0ABR1AQR2_POLSC